MIGLLLVAVPVVLLYTGYNKDQFKDYKGESHWSYAGEKSVFHWGEEEANKLCGTGKEQSPIDVPKETAKGTATYVFNYTETEFTGTGNGHTIQFTPTKDNQNSVVLNGEVFKLVQFHFHNPSEHQVGGVMYPMEVHFVHKSDAGKLAVVGAVIEASETPTLTGFWKENDSKATITKQLNLGSIIQGGGKHYKGSLTTPPCSEGVEWLVLDQHQTMKQEEMNMYRQLLGGETNRPVEPINNREITQI